MFWGYSWKYFPLKYLGVTKTDKLWNSSKCKPQNLNPQGPVIIASAQGGINIEEVAAADPEAIIYEPIDIAKGLSKEQAVKVAEKVGLCDQSEEIAKMLLNMYDLFVQKDALLIEINPYAEDALEDCKFLFS